MVNIKYVRCPGQAFSGVWPPFWATSSSSLRRTRPRAMPLATMTMKTQTHGFLNFFPRTVVMGLRSAALRAAGELRYKSTAHRRDPCLLQHAGNVPLISCIFPLDFYVFPVDNEFVHSYNYTAHTAHTCSLYMPERCIFTRP